MSDAIRVGLIGYGYASKTFHAPLISGTPGMELSTVVSSDAQKVLVDWPATQVVASANSLYADPDIDLIVIPTPNDTHAAFLYHSCVSGVRWFEISTGIRFFINDSAFFASSTC